MFNLWPRQPYRHLNKIKLDSRAVTHNFTTLQNFHPEAMWCPVIKSNAYGHGLKEMAPLFDKCKPPFLVVDSLYEAYELYKQRIKAPILIMGYTHPDNFKIKKLPFSYAVWDLELVKLLNATQPGAGVHIFVDTGMNREGILLKDLPAFVDALKTFSNLKIEGLCSHFADADNPESTEFTHQQLEQFKKAYDILKSKGIDPQWRHISASAGAFKIKDPIFTMFRGGLASYGLTPLAKHDSFSESLNLRPVLSFWSTLAQIKKVPAGSLVGYNCTYQTSSEVTLGLLPAGYYEGVDRGLSNQGFVKVKDVLCPIVGRVSMNMTTIDISQVPHPETGEACEIYGTDPQALNSVSHAAKLAKTIPYQIITKLAESIKREVI